MQLNFWKDLRKNCHGSYWRVIETQIWFPNTVCANTQRANSIGIIPTQTLVFPPLHTNTSQEETIHDLWRPLAIKLLYEVSESTSILLDGQGRARREAARRRKSECKVNLDILNSSRSSGSKRLQKLYPRTTWRMDLRQLTAYEHFGCVNICAHTFFVCGAKFTTSPRKLWWGYSH